MRLAPTGRPRVSHHRRRSRTLASALLVLVAVLLLASCGGGDSAVTIQDTRTSVAPAGTATTASTQPATATSGSTTSTASPGTVSVYFAFNEKVQPVHRTATDAKVPARAAVEALLEGPTKDEAQVGVSSEVPDGTRLLGSPSTTASPRSTSLASSSRAAGACRCRCGSRSWSTL